MQISYIVSRKDKYVPNRNVPYLGNASFFFSEIHRKEEEDNGGGIDAPPICKTRIHFPGRANMW
jgi:hypothetical protein